MPKIVKQLGVAIIGAAIFAVGTISGNPALIAFGTKVFIAGVVTGGLSLASSIFIKKPKIDLSGILDRLNLSVNPNANGKWVFGLTAAGTDVVFADVTGAKKDVAVQIVLAAFHQINSFQRFWINDELVTFTGTAATGAWAGVLSRDTRLGTQTQLAISSLTSSAWPATAQGLGLAHYSLEYKLGSDKLSGGIPTRITAEVEGALVYDPRLDTTVGGSGLHRANDQTTWAFVNLTNQIGRNWVLIVLHYILGWRLNGKLAYGVGADPADIDYPQWIAMANVADQLVDAKPRYRVGGIFDLDGSHERVLGELEALIGGKIGRFGGKWTVWVPHDDLIPFNSITESDLIREVGASFNPAGPVADLFNVSRGTFVDPESIYQGVEWPEVRESTAVTEDGGERILELDLPMIQDVQIAQRVARERVRRTRFSGTWSFALGPKGLLFRPFDVTTINIKETNFITETVRIIAMEYTLQGVVAMEVIEEDASIYDITLPLGSPITQLDPGAFDPATAIAVTGLAAVPITIIGSSGTATDVLKITWADPGGLVADTEVQIRVNGTIDWISLPAVSVDLMFAFTGPLEPGTLYDVQARHITIFGVIGPWSALINATAGSNGLVATQVSGFLTNETHAVAAESDGTGYDLTTAGGTFHVLVGTSDVTGVGPVYSVLNVFETGTPVAFITVDGLRMTMNAVTGVYTLSDDPTWIDPGNIGNAYTLRAVFNGVTIDKTYTIIKSLGGVNAKLLSISATSQTFKYDTDGVFVGDPNITFTALQQNTAAPMVWLTQKWNGVNDWVNTTINRMSVATGLVSVLTEAAFAAEGQTALRVWAHFEDPPGQFHIDTMTVTRIQDGAQGLPGAAGADGAAGVNARAVALTAAAQSFTYNPTASPATSIITATKFNSVGTAFYNFFKNDVSVQHTTGNTYLYTPQASFAAMPDKIEVELREGSIGNPVLARDQMSMIGLQAGSDAVTVILSNEAHTLPTTNLGVVTYTGSGTTVRAFQGAAALIYVTSAPGNGQWTFTSRTVTSGTITQGALSGTGTTTATIAQHSAMTTDQATITLTINGKLANGVVFSGIVKVQSLAKSKDGADGSAGPAGSNTAVVFLYQRTASATPPAVPSTSKTYTFATGLLTSSVPWTQSIPAASASLQFLWVTTAVATATGTTDTITTGEWATPVIQNQDGIQTRAVFIYQRTASATPPATPTTASATYTFSTGVLSAVNNGWTQAIPSSGGAFLWVSQATALASALAATDTIGASEWSAAVQLAKDGADGGGGATVASLSNTAVAAFNGQVCGYQVHNDGTIDRRQGGASFVDFETWRVGSDSSFYECRMTKTEGQTIIGFGSVGTWLDCANINTWNSSTGTSIEKLGTTLIEIRRKSDNIVVGSAFISWSLGGS